MSRVQKTVLRGILKRVAEKKPRGHGMSTDKLLASLAGHGQTLDLQVFTELRDAKLPIAPYVTNCKVETRTLRILGVAYGSDDIVETSRLISATGIIVSDEGGRLLMFLTREEANRIHGCTWPEDTWYPSPGEYRDFELDGEYFTKYHSLCTYVRGSTDLVFLDHQNLTGKNI
jgi:hypothetical protein